MASVDQYIRNQIEHHAKLTFQDEYRRICEKDRRTLRVGLRANGRAFGPQRLLDIRDPVRWTGLGKWLSLRPEECVKRPQSKPARSAITV